MRVERHWWNGDRSARGRRDVYIRTDGVSWEVEAQAGGATGQSRIHRCPGRQSAEILAGAWMGARGRWRLVPATDEPEQGQLANIGKTAAGRQSGAPG